MKTETKTFDVQYLSAVMQELLIDADCEVVIHDRAHNDRVVVPYDVAAAPDGLLPLFLTAGEAVWSDFTGQGGFGLDLKRDLGALLSWRIDGVRADSFSAVMLCTMEALSQAAGPDGLMVGDLSRVFDEATARVEARIGA